jgi:hypothetical protein
MPAVEPLGRLLLTFPSLIRLADSGSDSRLRSWIQVARTGSFVSKRYGTFSITKTDLTDMLRNFNEVTPKAPTELPVDFDHLSMDPKKPGDGIAAGWFKGLEVRGEGDELWGDVEWTPRAAEAIRNREYRFVSPSFVKDHTDKTGEKIGTTLLAAAITNHPFLENMQALTLYNFSAMGDLAITAPATAPSITLYLAEIGQRVSFIDDPELTPELTGEERAQVYEVKSCVGAGDDQFVRLTLNGHDFGWYRANQLNTARKAQTSSLPKDTTQEKTTMQKTSNLAEKAAAFDERVMARSKTMSLHDAIRIEGMHDAEGAEARRLIGLGAELVPESEAAVVLALASDAQDQSFDQMVASHADRHGVSLREAVHAVAMARPDLAATR